MFKKVFFFYCENVAILFFTGLSNSVYKAARCIYWENSAGAAEVTMEMKELLLESQNRTDVSAAIKQAHLVWLLFTDTS